MTPVRPVWRLAALTLLLGAALGGALGLSLRPRRAAPVVEAPAAAAPAAEVGAAAALTRVLHARLQDAYNTHGAYPATLQAVLPAPDATTARALTAFQYQSSGHAFILLRRVADQWFISACAGPDRCAMMTPR